MRKLQILIIMSICASLSACGGAKSSAQPGTPTNPSSTQSTTDQISISGSPATAVAAGEPYSFTPTATDNFGRSIAFTVANAPSWATFNTTTGELSGTAVPGQYDDIVITASDGSTTADLPAFAISVTTPAANSATLTWSIPTPPEDGNPLTLIAGYTIYYGTSAGALTKSVKIADPTTDTYVVSGLAAGTYYFAIATLNAGGAESAFSDVVSKTI